MFASNDYPIWNRWIGGRYGHILRRKYIKFIPFCQGIPAVEVPCFFLTIQPAIMQGDVVHSPHLTVLRTQVKVEVKVKAEFS